MLHLLQSDEDPSVKWPGFPLCHPKSRFPVESQMEVKIRWEVLSIPMAVPMASLGVSGAPTTQHVPLKRHGSWCCPAAPRCGIEGHTSACLRKPDFKVATGLGSCWYRKALLPQATHMISWWLGEWHCNRCLVALWTPCGVQDRSLS